jgi:hypothetical protein
MVLGVGMTGIACGGGQGSTDDSGTSMYALSTSQFGNHKTFAVNQSGCQLDTGVPVLKGDVVRTLASGTITGQEGGGFNGTGGGTFTPNGDTGFGGVLGLRFIYGLFACIGESIVFLGDDQVFTAPESGNVKLAINGYTGSPIGGQFDVDIYTLPTVTVATKPSILDNTRNSAQTVSVDATAGWVHTGIVLKRGQKTFIDAAGTLTGPAFPPQTGTVTYTPDGFFASWAGTAALLTNRAAYRLYAQVGPSFVDVGSHAAFLSPANGELLLAVNNYPTVRSDSVTGTLAASVSLGVVPARDLTPEDLLSFTQHDTLTVAPADGWATANIHVEAGDPIFAQATGTVTDGTDHTTHDPFGETNTAAGSAYPVGMHPVLALFGSLGSEIEYVGGQDVFLAPTAAQLKVVINAKTGDTGQFTVTAAAP